MEGGAEKMSEFEKRFPKPTKGRKHSIRFHRKEGWLAALKWALDDSLCYGDSATKFPILGIPEKFFDKFIRAISKGPIGLFIVKVIYLKPSLHCR